MNAPKYSPDLEALEIQLVLSGLFRYYGFDFRNYAPASLKCRIWNTIRSEQLMSVAGLQEKVLHDPACLERFLLGLSVNVTAMFRDPSFYLALRSKVVPKTANLSPFCALRTSPPSWSTFVTPH